MNHFPHTYLTTNKSTIPVSLVHVVLHLARHVGLDVSPVNFPGTVLGRVETGDEAPNNFFLINPSAPNVHDSILLPNFGPTLTLPGNAEQLILRASRNVEASLMERTNQTREFASAAASCTVTLRLLLVGENQDIGFPAEWKQLLPIEYYALATTLPPFLDEDRGAYLEEFCKRGLEVEEREAFLPSVKHHTDTSVEHFVGMVFRHRKETYIGCIVGWDVSIPFLSNTR
jgi:F-box protein 21